MTTFAVAPALEPARLYLERDMEEVEVLGLGSGRGALFTARAPDKDGPSEDAAALVSWSPVADVLAVADGAGGSRGGGHAARLALEALTASLERGAGSGLDLRSAVLDGIECANQRIAEEAAGAATTLALVTIEGGRARPFHVGDSAILVTGQRGRVKHQSVAHGPVGYGVEAGLLDEREAMHHEDRHLVSNVVGSAEMRIEVGPSLALAPRDTVVVASDGLSDNLYVAEIVDCVRKGPIEEAARVLRDLVRARMAGARPGQPSKPDDLTFLLYRPAR